MDKILRFKPDYLKQDNFMDYVYDDIEKYPENRETLTFIQFTDLHLDLDYVPGSSVTCNTVMCCRAENGFPEDPLL